MTPQELKNSILQLAIQGKLVEQRPEEGTAEELAQRLYKYTSHSKQASALHSVSGSLDARLKDFFNLLQKKCEAGEGKVKMLDLAAELNVSPAAITKMKKRLAAAIQAKAAELADE